MKNLAEKISIAEDGIFLFNKVNGERLDLEAVVKEIIDYINEDNSANYKISIGSDSENHQGVDFVTAIVIHRVGRGGRYFWRRLKDNRSYQLRQRIFQEVWLSLKLGQELLALLRKEGLTGQNLEIHVDVGTEGETRTLITEVVGMIRGSGFDVKIKPESYSAFCVADKYV